MNLVSNGVKYHDKEPQRFFNRLFFIYWALWLLHILCLFTCAMYSGVTFKPVCSFTRA